MVSGKSTRWDCDVNLWRGIPDGFPSFHGWRSDVPHGSSWYPEPTTDARFYVCHHCNSYVPEVDVPGHPCWDYTEETVVQEKSDPALPNIAESPCDYSSDDGYVCDWDDWRKEKEVVETKPKYVVANEENSVDGFCFLCKERLCLKYDHDEEEWIYPDCTKVDGRVVHEACYSAVYT